MTFSNIKSNSIDGVSEFAENIFNTVREPLIALNKNLRVVKANQSFYDFFKVTPIETIGIFIYNLINNQWDISKLRELLETILPEKTSFENYEVESSFPSIGKRILLLNARKIQKEQIILLAIEDITQRKLAEKTYAEHKHIEELLQHSEEKYRLLSEFSPEMIYLIDLKGCITYLNKAAGAQFRVNPSEMIGKHISNIFPSDTAYQNMMAIQKVIDSKTPFYIEKEMKFPFGNLWLSTRLVPVFNKENRVISVLGLSIDISERKKSEHLVSMLAQSLKSINEIVSITDMEDKIIFVNESYLKTYGYDENDLIGKHAALVMSPINPINLADEIFSATRLGGWKGKVWDIKKDGSEFPIYLSTSIIYDNDGKPLGLMGVAIDITESTKVELDLIKAKERAELANKLKDAFIANISHEIRTPLNGILGMSSLIRDILPVKIRNENNDLFEKINYSSRRLIRTVDMILCYSLLQVGEFPLYRNSIVLSAICIKLITEYFPIAKNKSLDLTFQNNCGNVTIFADEYSFTLAVSNLIDNAIKYTKKGSVHLNLYRSGDENLILDIKDTGIGIGQEFLDKIFEPYHQEQMGYGRSYEGIGLGLSLVNKILPLNNAKLSVESKRGEGTTFSINFGIQ